MRATPFRKRALPAVAVAAALVLGTLSAPAGAGDDAATIGPTKDYGQFLNILPAGQGSNLTPAQAAAFFADGTLPPHSYDQAPLYADLATSNLGALTDAKLGQYFKSEGWVLPEADVVSTIEPRDGLVIARDTWGVPHVYGESREAAAWGAGYVTASDRLFMIDVLRHIGRGRLSELLGPCEANLAYDRSTYLAAGYSDAELIQQVEKLASFGPIGEQVIADGQAFVEGINARLDELRADPSQLPAEYGALQIAPQDWEPQDVVAVAILIQATFAGGGGGEVRNAVFLQEATAKHGAATAAKLYRDLRTKEDPQAPVTTSLSFPYMVPGAVDPAAVAIPDPGSIEYLDPITTSPPAGDCSAPGPASLGGSFEGTLDPAANLRERLARIGLDFPGAMSNWLAVTGSKTASGHPIAVMGPQTGYFSPQILMEIDIHAPGFNGRGATFPGISLYTLLGRGPDFAWSATSGGSDLIDTRAELLCEPGGGEPSIDSTHYVFKGDCVPMLVRDDRWFAKPTAGGPGTPTLVEAHVERTVHGPVFARATVDGEPVALVQQRSTFFGELDSAIAFVKLMNGSVKDPASFASAMNGVTGSFNWLYVDDEDVSFFHSGKYPVRAKGVDPDLPSWGTGQWEWLGFVSQAAHPQETNPARGWMASWNNKPARAWRAADSNWGFGPVHRSEMLSDRLAARIPSGGVRRADMVRIMADAATVDLRGQEDVPVLLDLIGTPPADLAEAVGLLEAWVASGAHRIDRDGDGEYEHQAAVALMDAWWDPLIHRAFDPVLGGLYDDLPIRFDDTNRQAGTGSSFQAGFYGYLERAVKAVMGQSGPGAYAVLRCANGTKAGCRSAVLASLRDAIEELGGGDPSSWDAQEESIHFSAIGLLELPDIPWQNRPTFQQVVMVTGHRPT